MRFDKGHKQQTRQRIVETAARRFRKDGVEAVGIAAMMADVGLTHGGFYAHFSSKEELVRAALEEGFAKTQVRRSEIMARTASGQQSLEAAIRHYLRPAHRDKPEHGCVAAALISEIARHGPETRAAFASSLNAGLEQFAASLPKEKSQDERERIAIAIFSTLLGALQMARAVPEKAMSDKILEVGVQAALGSLKVS